MKTYKAKIAGRFFEFQAVIYINKLWRIFGTPYSKGKGYAKPFTEARIAKRAAKKLAAELNIMLEWEV